MKSPLSFLVTLLFLALPASAQLISGVVLDPMGNPLPGMNINAYDSSGAEATLTNDGTDAAGNFLTLITDGPGTYTIEFVPPAPPTTSYLTKHVANVVVPAGTAAMGTIQMEPGVAVLGRVVRAGALPVGNVDLHVIDGNTGLEVPLRQLKTSATGDILICVPAHPVELRLDASSAIPVLASQAYDLNLSVATDLGDLVLPPGITISGTVRRPSGAVVPGVDLDFRDPVTGAKEYTPGDNTNASGNFAVVVAAGTYDIEFCPPAGVPLAGLMLFGQVLNTSTSIGFVTLPNGILLSGNISLGGNPVEGADVDAFYTSNGVEAVLCSDNSDAAGNYSVYIPAGTYNIVFTPPPCGGAGQDIHPNVNIVSATVLNGILPGSSASSSVFVGDGINLDLVSPVNMVIGQSWSAPLTLGHGHGASGPLSLRIRTGTVNGPNVNSPFGGRPVENLITGSLLAVLTGSHNGSTGGISPLLVPNDACFVGLGWAAQYTVVGGGFGDLSRAVFGVIGAQ
jgi:hypothetical protein